LESYNPYLHPQKVSKNEKIHCIHNSLRKNAKSRIGSLGPLGVKIPNVANGSTAPKILKTKHQK
jgi:hypothetical protein